MSDLIAEGLAAAKRGDSFERARLHDELQHRLFSQPKSPPAFGRFTIIRRLGQGAMGLVYLAYDPVLDRNVALKLLHPEASGREPDGASGGALQAEARAIAKLSHPNVVTVYEVGDADGRSFLSMEYVDGENLEDWLAAGPRERAEVLAVFEEAGKGLAAAHQASIIHRDFKPRNVLVARDGRVCVADFGLARVSDADPAPEPTIESEALARATSVAGTPAYMAPEVRDGFAASARSDQYSFCVALYEALHGLLPGAQGRLSRPGAAIDAALTRGLAEDPTRRHPSMGQLVGVLHRARQRRGSKIAAALVVLPLIAGVGWWAGASREDETCRSGAEGWASVWGAQQQATVRAQLLEGLPSEAVVERILGRFDELGAAWREGQDAACALRLEDNTSVVAQLQLRCLDARLWDARAAVETLSTSSSAVASRADAVLDGIDDVERCQDIADLTGRPGPPTEPGQARDYAHAVEEIRTAAVEVSAGLPAEALSRLEGVRDVVEALRHPTTDSRFFITSGKAHTSDGDYAAARREFVRAHQRSVAAGDRRLRVEAEIAMAALVGNSLARHDEGLDWARMAEAELDELVGEASLRVRLIGVEARIHVARSEFAKALETADEGLRILDNSDTSGAPSPQRAELLMTRASAYVEQGKVVEALRDGEAALAEFRLVHGERHPAVGIACNNLAKTHTHQGAYDKAAQFAADALSIFEETREPSHPDIALAHNNLGTALASQGRFVECLAHFEQALQIWSVALGEVHPNVAGASGNLALALMFLDRDAEALEHARRALAVNTELFGEEHDDVALQRLNVARIYVATGRAAEAVPEVEQVVGYWRRRPNTPAVQLAEALVVLGISHRLQEHWPDAVASLDEAISLFGNAGTQGVSVHDARIELAMALWSGKLDRKRAIAEIASARRWLLGDGESWASYRLGEVDSFIREAGVPLPTAPAPDGD